MKQKTRNTSGTYGQITYPLQVTQSKVQSPLRVSSLFESFKSLENSAIARLGRKSPLFGYLHISWTTEGVCN